MGMQVYQLVEVVPQVIPQEVLACKAEDQLVNLVQGLKQKGSVRNLQKKDLLVYCQTGLEVEH